MLILSESRRSTDLGFSILRIVLVLGLALLIAACGKNSEPATDVRHYDARGLVRGLPPDHKTVEVEHEDIPGFMPSMTMPFSVRDGSEIADLKIGDAISFRLNVTNRDSWIDRVLKIDPGQLHLPAPAPAPVAPASDAASARLHEGDSMPDFHLIDQDGQPISLQTYRGHPFVLTFIFTRCPLPNFCPRISQNFAELQKSIKAATSETLASARLLSISFDPANDTPAVLRVYGEGEGADPKIWNLATGTPAEIQRLTKAFSVLVQPEGGTISHSLATALVDKDGKIEKLWRGNGWTVAEVTQQIGAASEP